MINPSQFDIRRLIDLMFTGSWQHQCEIITNFVYPQNKTAMRPIPCVVKCGGAYLRYSNGPLQGYFWDTCGDDFHTPELALLALSRTFSPPGVSNIPTYGNPFRSNAAVDLPGEDYGSVSFSIPLKKS